MRNSNVSAFSVPMDCPLPRSCPRCDEPAVKTIKIKASEGIPMVFTFKIKVPVNYCAQHFKELRGLRNGQWAAIFGVPFFLLLQIFIQETTALRGTLLLSTMFAGKVGCVVIALWLGSKIASSCGLKIRAHGSTPVFTVEPTNESWAFKARANVERYFGRS